eukprot:1736636-Lingulodinium_polyedra.AAC.1
MRPIGREPPAGFGRKTVSSSLASKGPAPMRSEASRMSRSRRRMPAGRVRTQRGRSISRQSAVRSPKDPQAASRSASASF